MEELRVFDLYKDGKGVFQFMNEIEPLPFAEYIDPKTIDLTFITFYGNREVSAPIKTLTGGKITKENMKQIATMLYGMYYQKWTNLYEIYKDKVDLDSYLLETTEKIKDDGTSTNSSKSNGEDKDTHSVTGFNSEEMTEESQNQNTTQNSTTNEEQNKNLKDRETISRGNLGNRIEDRQKALNGLNQEVIQDVVFKDTVQLVGSLMF